MNNTWVNQKFNAIELRVLVVNEEYTNLHVLKRFSMLYFSIKLIIKKTTGALIV